MRIVELIRVQACFLNIQGSPDRVFRPSGRISGQLPKIPFILDGSAKHYLGLQCLISISPMYNFQPPKVKPLIKKF